MTPTVSCSTVLLLGSRFRDPDEDPPSLDANLVNGHAYFWIVEALPCAQIEALLVDGRGDLRDPALVADDPPGEHEGLAERIEVADGVDGVGRRGADERHLPAAEKRADTGARNHVLESADILPGGGACCQESLHPTSSCETRFSSQVAGRCCARCRRTTTLGSGASEFTKVRKRRSLTGSSTVAFHSQR